MSKHVDRIWRSVVFAGAMLGAPLVTADPAKPAKPAKPAPKAPPTVASVTKEIAEVDRKIKLTVDAVAAARTEADRKAAKAKLEVHRKQKADLEAKLADLKAGGKPLTPIAKLERELADVNARLDKQLAAVTASRTEAERKAAQAKLAPLQKEKAEVERRLVAEREKAAPRPRTPEPDRPIGRGFVLA